MPTSIVARLIHDDIHNRTIDETRHFELVYQLQASGIDFATLDLRLCPVNAAGDRVPDPDQHAAMNLRTVPSPEGQGHFTIPARTLKANFGYAICTAQNYRLLSKPFYTTDTSNSLVNHPHSRAVSNRADPEEERHLRRMLAANTVEVIVYTENRVRCAHSAGFVVSQRGWVVTTYHTLKDCGNPQFIEVIVSEEALLSSAPLTQHESCAQRRCVVSYETVEHWAVRHNRNDANTRAGFPPDHGEDYQLVLLVPAPRVSALLFRQRLSLARLLRSGGFEVPRLLYYFDGGNIYNKPIYAADVGPCGNRNYSCWSPMYSIRMRDALGPGFSGTPLVDVPGSAWGVYVGEGSDGEGVAHPAYNIDVRAEEVRAMLDDPYPSSLFPAENGTPNAGREP
jgi:hypothetical protein